jgi:hypothetical protein
VRKAAPLHSINERQIRESLGILNAFHLPPPCRAALRPDLTPINTMRIVFACLGGEPAKPISPMHFIVRPNSPQRGKLRRVSIRGSGG